MRLADRLARRDIDLERSRLALNGAANDVRRAETPVHPLAATGYGQGPVVAEDHGDRRDPVSPHEGERAWDLRLGKLDRHDQASRIAFAREEGDPGGPAIIQRQQEA